MRENFAKRYYPFSKQVLKLKFSPLANTVEFCFAGILELGVKKWSTLANVKFLLEIGRKIRRELKVSPMPWKSELQT